MGEAAATEKVRKLNDDFRQTFVGGKVFFTQAVNSLPDETKLAVIKAVQSFTDFNEANDPHNEHDFVSFEIGGDKFFGKIDYYDANLEYGSENPADPSRTTRVLTIGFMSDY